MEHPLITDINDLTVEQLQSRISDLSKKLMFAQRMNNAHLAGQIRMALETFNNKYQAKLKETYEAESKKGPDFSDKINIS